jgi:hypothetical protein
MSTQNLLTVDKATTIRQDGEAEFVTLDAAIQPGRYTFANFDATERRPRGTAIDMRRPGGAPVQSGRLNGGKTWQIVN